LVVYSQIGGKGIPFLLMFYPKNSYLTALGIFMPTDLTECWLIWVNHVFPVIIFNLESLNALNGCWSTMDPIISHSCYMNILFFPTLFSFSVLSNFYYNIHQVLFCSTTFTLAWVSYFKLWVFYKTYFSFSFQLIQEDYSVNVISGVHLLQKYNRPLTYSRTWGTASVPAL
jgi:hypothetical protein